MFGKSKQDIEKEKTRERVRRYREKKRGGTASVTQQAIGNGAGVTEENPAVTNTKMVCKCMYFIIRDGILVCSVCGKPPQKKRVEDRVQHAVETK